MRSRLHIHARDVVPHDAVGNFAHQVADLAEQQGWDALVWAENAGPNPYRTVMNRSGFWKAVAPGDIIFFNLSIHDPIMPEVLALPQRKILYYHNITPPDLIDACDPATRENCRLGREQRALAAGFDGLIANSNFSATDLAAGFPAHCGKALEDIKVCPPRVGLDRWPAVPSKVEPKPHSVLYVGRIVPHKGLIALLEGFALYATRQQRATLTIVGGPAESDHVSQIRRRADAIALATGATVTIQHGLSDEALAACYHAATACVTMSEHEGFCVPALDAIVFDKPFLTAPLPAVEEILGDSGLMLADRAPQTVADGLIQLLDDPAFARQDAQRRVDRRRVLARATDGKALMALIGG